MAFVGDIDAEAVISPGPELHFAVLRVEWEILNVNAAFALESDWGEPDVLPRVVQDNSEVQPV